MPVTIPRFRATRETVMPLRPDRLGTGTILRSGLTGGGEGACWGRRQS